MGMGFLADFSNLGGNILTEIQILKSNQLVGQAIERMPMKVSYYQEGRLLTSEVYKNSPFTVIDLEGSVIYGHMFSLRYLGGNKYSLGNMVAGEEIWKEYYFGEKAVINQFVFRIIKNENSPQSLDKESIYKWRVNTLSELIARARSGLTVEQEGYTHNMINIYSADYVAGFATDFVNALCRVYIENDSIHKTQAATQALAFIEDQLVSLERKVVSSELKLEYFKRDKEVFDIDQTGSMGMAKLQILEEKYAEYELQKLAIDQLELQVRLKNESLGTLSFSFEGSSGPLLNTMVAAYNELSLERMELLQKHTPNSPKLKEIELRIEEMRKSIHESIRAIKLNNSTRLTYFRDQIKEAKTMLKGIPETQRMWITLDREYKVNENVYSSLLEKRAEASIAKASIVGSVRVVDLAKEPNTPISPNAQKVYTIGAGTGFSLSVVFILFVVLLKNTISFKEEIEAISLTPVIGVVRRSTGSLKNKYPRLMIVDNPKSGLSESIRAIRTNLQFISPDKKSKIISITSTISGEGKSFIILNLAGIISLLKKKVVILDLDLRKPKLHHSFGKDNSIGLSTFLVGKHELKDIKFPTEYENLDIITSGPIPPNPAELLQSLRMELLLMELRKTYDYILIDTPPIGLVTDGTSILRASDISLYVLRADYSKKNFAEIPDQLVEDHKIKNLYIVLNSVSEGGGKYGRYGKYGNYGGSASGYYVEEAPQRPWWKFFRKNPKA